MLPFYIGEAEYVILEINNGKIENVELKLIDYDINIVKEKIKKSKILEEDTVLMNLSFCAISGKGSIRQNFLK